MGVFGQTPINRFSPAFAYSPVDRAIVMFGGGTRNDTWAIEVETKSWVRMRPLDAPGSPGRRGQIENSMVYDSQHDVFILFGGECKSTSQCGQYNALLNDTWAYHLPSNTWTKRIPPVSPPVRKQHQMSYDSRAQVTVMFGGKAPSGRALDDLWIYDYAANTWTQLLPGVSPPPTNLGSMVYDPDREASIMYHSRDLWTLRIDSFEAGNPMPSLTSLSPDSAMQGGPGFTLTVKGGNFVTSSVVRWNGATRSTVVVSGTELQASIPSSDLGASGAAQVTVFTGAPGGGVSNALPFGVNASGKDLTIEGLTLSPSTLAAGDSTTVGYRVVNRGTTLVTETYTDRIYLSSMSTLDGTARLLGKSHGHTADLALNATHANAQATTIPADSAPGSYFILVETDALKAVAEANEGNNVTAIPVTVSSPPANQVIVDNAAAGTQDPAGGRTFTGSWCTSSRPNPFGADSLYSCGDGSDTYRWTPNILAAGLYDVFVRWTSGSLRSTSVPITVIHDGGTATRLLNQQTGGGQWHLHGRYPFVAGQAGYMEASDANGQAAADACAMSG